MAKSKSRAVENCVYRSPLHGGEAFNNEGDGICGLLSEISGVKQHPALTVPNAACQACCNAHPPSKTDPNSVVASLLVVLAEEIQTAGGVADCSAEQAEQLGSWAEKCLPAVSPDEDDTLDIACKNYDHLASVRTEAIERHLPIPDESKLESRSKVKTWAVGITTSPRRLPTLETCVQSVIQAGWAEPILFVDGDVELPDSLLDLECSRRQTASGAFPNYVLSLAELYMRDPHADAYLIIQDDALCLPSPATRQYLERVLWPFSGACIASLYCSKKYNQAVAGWHLFPESWVWGAVAFTYSNEAVRQVLTASTLWEHRTQPGRDGLSKIDVVVGQIAKSHNIPLIFPSPSLIQHIGAISTIWDHARAVNARYADEFIGDFLSKP